MRRVGKTAEETAEDQRDSLMREAERLGYEIVREYNDAGRGGLSLDGLPQLRRLLKDAEQGSFQHLLIRDLSRLSRGPMEMSQAILGQLWRCGVTVRDPDIGVLTETVPLRSFRGDTGIKSALWPEAAAAEAASALCHFMSAVCENQGSISWRRAIEYELWLCALAGQDRASSILELLARFSGGWWMGSGEGDGKPPDGGFSERDLKFVPLDEWLAHYDAWLAGGEPQSDNDLMMRLIQIKSALFWNK